MITLLDHEYQNQNAKRYYPFEDNATLTDTDGIKLPVDFLLDAQLYPLDLVRTIYLSSINLMTGVISFSDSGTGTVIGTATYVSGADTAVITEYEKYDRQIGMLAFGAGVAELATGGPIRTFMAEATTFCPAVVTSMAQAGVRGFLLPDGTLVTGAVTFEGRDGVIVSSEVDITGLKILRFDILGVDAADDPCTDDSAPPICSIVATRQIGSSFVLSEYDTYVLGLNAFGFTLDDVCARRRGGRLPSATGILPNKAEADDPCGVGSPDDPAPTDPGVQTLTFNVCTLGKSAFNVVTPTLSGEKNPVYVRTLDSVVAQQPNRLSASSGSQSELEAAAKAFGLPALSSGGIIIGFKGVK